MKKGPEQGRVVVDASDRFEGKRLLDRIFAIEDSPKFKREVEDGRRVWDEEIMPRGRKRLEQALSDREKIVPFPSVKLPAPKR